MPVFGNGFPELSAATNWPPPAGVEPGEVAGMNDSRSVEQLPESPAAKKLVIPSRAMLSISWSSTVRYIGEPKYATVVSPAPYEWLVISTGQAVAGSCEILFPCPSKAVT